MEQIVKLVDEGKITGISDIRDESDRDGMRVVVELKRGKYCYNINITYHNSSCCEQIVTCFTFECRHDSGSYFEPIDEAYHHSI